MKKTKFIFVTGGVVSSLGKGIAAASGIVIGPAYTLGREEYIVPRQQIREDEIPLQIQLFEEALIKTRREIIDLQHELSSASNHRDLGETFEVLIEGISKRSDKQYFGRNSQNKVLVFPITMQKPGEYVNVKVKRVTSATLIGEAVN